MKIKKFLLMTILGILVSVPSLSSAKEVEENSYNLVEEYEDNIKPANEDLKYIENDLYEQRLINDTINKYINGDPNLNVVKDKNGKEKIIVNDAITITNLGKTDIRNSSKNFVKGIQNKTLLQNKTVYYNGEVTKPAVRLSDGVYAPKNRSAELTFTISGSFSYEISGGFGISFDLFQAHLGNSIRRTYTKSTTARYVVSKNKMGVIYGIRVYDEYKYNGLWRKGTLLSPSYYNMFLVER